jgi:hypothetical protein
VSRARRRPEFQSGRPDSELPSLDAILVDQRDAEKEVVATRLLTLAARTRIGAAREIRTPDPIITNYKYSISRDVYNGRYMSIKY